MKVAFGNGKLRALFQGKGRRELDRRIFYCCARGRAGSNEQET